MCALTVFFPIIIPPSPLKKKLEKPPHTHAQLDDLHEYRDDLYSILYKRCILHSADIHDIVLESLSEIVLLCMHDYYSNYGT